MPVVLVWGTADRIVPFAVAAKMMSARCRTRSSSRCADAVTWPSSNTAALPAIERFLQTSAYCHNELMVRGLRVLLATLVFLSWSALAGPDWPVSDARLGIAAKSTTGAEAYAAWSGEAFLVVWYSWPRGGQALLVDASGRPLRESSFGLPLWPLYVFWNEAERSWYVVGLGVTVNQYEWVRVSEEGVLLDREPAVLIPSAHYEGFAWTGSCLLARGHSVDAQGRFHLYVDAFEADLRHRTRHEIATDIYEARIASDGETALLVYRNWPSTEHSAVLFSRDGEILKAKPVSSDYFFVHAVGGSGDGRYFVVTQTNPGEAVYGGFSLDRDLGRLDSLPKFGQPGVRPYGLASAFPWNGSAFTFVFNAGGILHAAQFSASGELISDVDVIPYGGDAKKYGPFATTAGGGSTLLFYTRPGKEPSDGYLRLRAAATPAGLAAAKDLALELGAFEQVRPVAASSRTQSLVAWHERLHPEQPRAAFATRVDANGRVLDPQSIPLATTTCEQLELRAGSNGDGFLAAWFDDQGIMSAQIGGNGKKGTTARLGYRPFPTPHCEPGPLMVLSNGDDYLVVWSLRGKGARHTVRAVRLRADGTPREPIPFDLGTMETTILGGASNGRDYLLSWDGRAMRVDANGTLLDAKIDASSGLRLGDSGFSYVWWNGSSYTVLAANADQPAKYQFLRVTADGTVTPVGMDFSWPEIPANWGTSAPFCDAGGCSWLYGTTENGGQNFLREVRATDDGTIPTVSVHDARPVAPMRIRYSWERRGLAILRVPGAPLFAAYERKPLDAPYSGISRVFLHALPSRARAVRH
jgi:hypothetical protein